MRYWLSVILLFLCSAGWAENAALIETIRVQYQTIRASLPDYTVQETIVHGYSTEGSLVTQYFDHQRRLVIVNHLGETGRQDWEIYYHNQQPFFVLLQEQHYNAPIYWNQQTVAEYAEEGIAIEAFDPQKSAVKEWRMYLHQNNILRLLNPDGQSVINEPQRKFMFKHTQEITQRTTKSPAQP